MARDPRIDPRPGDVIRQPNARFRIEVTLRDEANDRVHWLERYAYKAQDNHWTLRGWQSIAVNAEILEVADDRAMAGQGGG
jgi:hypothetical protein